MIRMVFVLAAALERHPGRVIWEVDDWIFHDVPDIDSNSCLPADLYRQKRQGRRRLSLQRAHGGRVGVDVLRPDFDVAAAYNAKRASRPQK